MSQTRSYRLPLEYDKKGRLKKPYVPPSPRTINILFYSAIVGFIISACLVGYMAYEYYGNDSTTQNTNTNKQQTIVQKK
jgi:hypothetical protein